MNAHTLGVVLLLPETDRAEEDTKSQLCEQRALRACGPRVAPRGVLFRDASSGHANPRSLGLGRSGLAARPDRLGLGLGSECGWSLSGRPLSAWFRLGVWGIDERCGRRGFVAGDDSSAQARTIGFTQCLSTLMTRSRQLQDFPSVASGASSFWLPVRVRASIQR